MATKTKNKKKTPVNAEKFIKVRPADHTQIKVQAARKGKTMGEYVAALSRKDAEARQ